MAPHRACGTRRLAATVWACRSSCWVVSEVGERASCPVCGAVVSVTLQELRAVAAGAAVVAHGAWCDTAGFPVHVVRAS